MSSVISGNYRELRPDEVAQVAAECAKAWTDPAIPMRQYELAVKPELDKYRKGQPVAPFDALVRCLRQIPLKLTGSRSRLLDVGASSGYYREVLRTAGYYMQYTGCDFSLAFKDLAEKLHPGIAFDIADARALPYRTDEFDIVLNSAVLMHTEEYERVIRETARVAYRYAIFHRTPVFETKPTAAFLKEGYGIPMVEWHFNEAELLALFKKNGLTLESSVDVFWDGDFGHRSYLLSKPEGLRHHSV